MGDVLVGRRKAEDGKEVKEKHVNVIWALVNSIKSRKSVPRDLLKNGKRGKMELKPSQEKYPGRWRTLG